jgi:DmsE family decaheme c-type cytochrome
MKKNSINIDIPKSRLMRNYNKKILVVLASVFSVGITLSARSVLSQTDEQAQYAADGANTCLTCHNSPPVNYILNTPHAREADPRTPFSSHDCETCHGPSPEHMTQFQSPAVVFGTSSSNRRFPPSEVGTQNQACLNCHENGQRMHWFGSQHEFADVACASCHNIHTTRDAVLTELTQPQVCFQCHLDKRAEINKRSHHPINEGQLTCTDCHNPHGSPGTRQLAGNTVNETCYQCHAEKRGPFLWEHQPVREDCTNCHNPHGSTQSKLLNVRTPYLCQQCHSEPFHPSTLYSATGIPPTGAVQQLLGQGCLNCHSKVHGSNHPSGSRLTR